MINIDFLKPIRASYQLLLVSSYARSEKMALWESISRPVPSFRFWSTCSTAPGYEPCPDSAATHSGWAPLWTCWKKAFRWRKSCCAAAGAPNPRRYGISVPGQGRASMCTRRMTELELGDALSGLRATRSL